MKELIKKYSEIIRYIIIGVLTTIVSLSSYYLLIITVLNPDNALELQIANIISWILSVTFAYITNRHFVFKSKSKDIKKEALKFATSRITTLLIDMAFMFLTVTVLKFNAKIAKLIVQVIVLVLNYILSKLFVFKKIN
jgi:putative flippase GtrA